MNGEENVTRAGGGINTNTYVSLGIVIIVIGGAMSVLNAVYTSKTELSAQIAESTKRQDKIEWRLSSLENTKHADETWNYQDMFKWSVHLQRDNDGTNNTTKIHVPEPEPRKDQNTP